MADNYPAGVTDRNLERDLHAVDVDGTNERAAQREDEAFEHQRERELWE